MGFQDGCLCVGLVLMVVIHVLMLARLGKVLEAEPCWSSVGTRWDGDALDCASTDRPCLVMVLLLIFFLTPKIIKTKKNADIHECLF